MKKWAIGAAHQGCIILFTSLLIMSCAGTRAGHTVLQPIPKDVVLNNYLNLEVAVTPKNGESLSELTPTDTERIKNLIVAGINGKNPNRFKNINGADVNPSTLQVSINITRYDKGNAFARAMLAGLGQIHIDAEVNLKDAETQRELGRFEVKKTFAWGGAVGASTTIQDVEKGFVEEIVFIILGEG